jgi:hypothetical protein
MSFVEKFAVEVRNVATRFSGKGRVGEITYHQAEGYFNRAMLGSIPIKGKPEG